MCVIFYSNMATQDAESLLQDTLPVGKTLNATFKTGLQEQQYLRDTLQQFADEATATTQQLWKMNPHLHIRIQVPEQPTKLWCSVVAASARPKKYAEVWLEYLFWVALSEYRTARFRADCGV